MMKSKMGKAKGLENFGLMVKYSILIAPQGKMEFESAKYARKQGEFQFIWNLSYVCFDRIFEKLFFTSLKLEWNDIKFES